MDKACRHKAGDTHPVSEHLAEHTNREAPRETRWEHAGLCCFPSGLQAGGGWGVHGQGLQVRHVSHSHLQGPAASPPRTCPCRPWPTAALGPHVPRSPGQERSVRCPAPVEVTQSPTLERWGSFSTQSHPSGRRV